MLDTIANWLGACLVRYLSRASHVHGTAVPTDPVKLMACLQPGDVLLVEGQTRVSVAIKYLTQSTWSHAALYVGDVTGLADGEGLPRCFLEADIGEGVRAVSVTEFEGLHCRACRPDGLNAAEIDAVIGFRTLSDPAHHRIRTLQGSAVPRLRARNPALSPPQPVCPARFRRVTLLCGHQANAGGGIRPSRPRMA
jgi:hypothetical protein